MCGRGALPDRLEAFADARSPFSLITRGPLVVRDVDVLQRAAPRAEVDVTFSPDLLADVVRAARDAGATNVWCNILYLQPGTREHFLEHLARDWPELLPRYLETSARLKDEVAALTRRFAVADRRRRPLEPAPALEQLELDLPRPLFVMPRRCA